MSLSASILAMLFNNLVNYWKGKRDITKEKRVEREGRVVAYLGEHDDSGIRIIGPQLTKILNEVTEFGAVLLDKIFEHLSLEKLLVLDRKGKNMRENNRILKNK